MGSTLELQRVGCTGLPRFSLALLIGISLAGGSQAQRPAVALSEASLEELLNTPVISVSRKEQKLSKVGAAVYVISQEDIRRSGATNIPDLLRLAPGVEVAQVNTNRWAISIRGFNSVYSNKILLLIDGRPVYNSVSSSVFWDWEQIPLPDVARIEVIRGPGGTVWGANAMNGVINIITRNAQETRGGLLQAGTGSWQTADELLQYGGAAGRRGAYRIFGRYFNAESVVDSGGAPAADGWHGIHGGFRADFDLSQFNRLMVEGDLLRTAAGQRVTSVFSNALPLEATTNDRLTNTRGDILGRWDHVYSNGSQSSLQISYDWNHRATEAQLDEIHQTTEVEFQPHVSFGEHHDVVWGLGYRRESSDIRPSYGTQIVPAKSNTSLYSAFVQDEIRILPSLFFTLGSKFEHNDYTGFEYEPSAQLVWTPGAQHTLWASAARAIRQPSLVDFGLIGNLAILPAAGSFGVLTLFGSPLVRAEDLRDYEAGYRAQLARRLSLDGAVFWGFYRNLQTTEPQQPYFTATPTPPHMVFPMVFENKARARTQGVEMVFNWEVSKRWRISPGYSFLSVDVERDATSRDFTIGQSVGYSPQHHLQIRSFLDLRPNVDFDASMQYVSNLSYGHVPAYVRVDARLGWRPGEALELSIAGQNLAQPWHLEFFEMYGIQPAMVPRALVGSATWRF